MYRSATKPEVGAGGHCPPNMTILPPIARPKITCIYAIFHICQILKAVNNEWERAFLEYASRMTVWVFVYFILVFKCAWNGLSRVLKSRKFKIFRGSAPDHIGGAYSAPSKPPAVTSLASLGRPRLARICPPPATQRWLRGWLNIHMKRWRWFAKWNIKILLLLME